MVLWWNSSIERLALAKLKGFLRNMIDFTQSRVSSEIETSYVPGTVEMGQLFPGFLTQILKVLEFGKSMKGDKLYYTESRTLRLFSDSVTYEHQNKRTVSCGEGAGYAGGIISAAIDGENVL
jgi:uncharacterized FAD-dependent dehydrogenase